MPRKNCDFLRQFIGVTLSCALSGLLLWLLTLSQVRASQSTSGLASASARVHPDANLSPTITVEEAEDIINLLPATKELRAKGMDVKWDVQAVPTMNNTDYYFFWIYNATAQKERDIGSISVGTYAVNKHTADVRVWQVSNDVFHGEDGVLVAANELERLQEELRTKQGIDSTAIQQYRSAHLAKKIIPRELAQSAVRLPISERSSDTAGLSCWKGSEHLASRLGRSPIMTSSAGYRAFAEVKATAFRPKYQETYSGLLCENTVKLFFAKGGESDSQILLDSSQPKSDCIAIEGRDSCEVNGIQLVDWSSDGRFLLADMVLWEYESDALVMRVPIIYDVTKSEFIRPDVYHFFDEYYKTSFFKEKPEPSAPRCEFELRTEGFSPDGNIIVSASRPPDDPSFVQEFCLDKKQTFLFELGTNKITRLPSNYKLQHYGTRKPGDVSKPSS
jgi:hypothetical protein